MSNDFGSGKAQIDDCFLSVVSPCYNERDSLAELYRRVTAVCREVGKSYELVLVNDGSRDDTWEMMAQLAARDSHVVAVNLSRNHGHQLALSAGLSVCRGEQILIIDADLQDPPELLPQMIARMASGVDVVYGQRVQRLGESKFKKVTASIFYRVLARLTEVDIPLDTGDFRLISRRALNVLNSMPEHYRFIRGMVSWIGFRQEAIPYERAERYAGETKYPIALMLRLAWDALTGFSVQPLRLASYCGLVFSMGSLLMLGYVIGSWLMGHVVEGWTSLTSIVLVLGSVQLLMIGVVGEYLGRLYLESKRRPLFIISDVLNGQVPATLPDPQRRASKAVSVTE